MASDFVIRVARAVRKHQPVGTERENLLRRSVVGHHRHVASHAVQQADDVVFDAVTVNGATVVTLQAAGGTMPLYIEDNEVHELFGVSQSTMVNTYDKQAKAPVIFRLKNRYNDIKDIPVRVNDVILPAEVGKAPGKLCCPTTCEWTDERQNIEIKYPNFQAAVENGNINWWE